MSGTERVTLIWTLLPDPAVTTAPPGTIPLTLVISIRLSTTRGDPPGTAVLPLSAYPPVADWPSFAYEPLNVVIGQKDQGGVTVTRSCDAHFTGGPPDRALWKALFPPELPVDPFVFDAPAERTAFRSYPAARVRQALSDIYTGLLPPEPEERRSRSAADRWAEADRLVRRVGGFDDPFRDAAVHRELLRAGALPDDDARDSEGWFRLAAFHRPLNPPPARRTSPILREAGTPYEFHALLAALADHSGLLHPLHLVRQLTVDLGPEPLLDKACTLRADPSHQVSLKSYRPLTGCIARSGRIGLADRDGGTAPVVLPLDDTNTYTPIDYDVDAGALALRSYAATLRDLPRDEPPPLLRPPALRSDGIHVDETNRQISFGKVLARAAEIDEDIRADHDDGDNMVMDAATVQQGIRVDVFDCGSRHWYPLCRRTGRYTVKGLATPLPIDDEGIVTDAVTAGTDDDGHPVQNLTQALFRWNNWSLVAEPPGRTVGIDGTVTDPAPQQAPGLPFTTAVSSPDGTLPTLRYGRSYRFRARVVDIAGRSLPFTRDPAPGDHATKALVYTRYDPVPAPVLVLRRPVGAGETPTVLVVRTDNADPGAPVAGQACERHLLAPKAALETIERHGVLDLPGKHRTDPAVHALLAQYDAGKITGTPDQGAGGSPYLDTDNAALPWLPDPLARGIALHGVPGTPELLTLWPAGGPAWYARLPLRLIVAAGPMNSTVSQAVADPAARTVRVTLAPAADFPAALSSLFAPGEEKLLGPWSWYTGTPGLPDAAVAAARTAARSGQSGQLTPATDLVLVHAVRCPVKAPAFAGARILREPGATAYFLDDPAMSVHGASTLTVHTEASWTDTNDEPALPEAQTAPSAAVLQPVAETAGKLTGPGGPALTALPFRTRHDPGDTRHRLVTFTPVGTSRFVPYFIRRSTGALPANLGSALVPGTVTVRASVPALTAAAAPAPPGTTYRETADYTVDYKLGKVARTDGGTIPAGKPVEVSYAVPPVTRSGPPVTLHVPSTVAPPAPEVHSVLPAFTWSRTVNGTASVSIREEGWVRVQLKRPWYVTGAGELLGVRVAGTATPAGDREWATAWATDPIRPGKPMGSPYDPVGHPGPADLTGYATDLDLGAAGHVLGYRVDYDRQRQLWCADIRFKCSNSYQPFVRLQVVRFQPDSLTSPHDLRLSPVADAGFVQLPAYRRARTVVGGTTKGSPVEVTVVGPVPIDGEDGLTSRITAVVQFRSTTLLDEVGWLTLDTDTPVELVKDPAAGAVGVWTGTVRLPANVGERAMRVLIREYDIQPDGPGGGPTSRISYLDTVPVPE
ncbi:hypothetical protein ACFYXL_21755 [Streptomyces tsukubensis]|uniref:hypothetical protein n=1 Tax=Streptomyces tsukubensis TaxID=83656 RepID=UPI00369A4429